MLLGLVLLPFAAAFLMPLLYKMLRTKLGWVVCVIFVIAAAGERRRADCHFGGLDTLAGCGFGRAPGWSFAAVCAAD